MAIMKKKDITAKIDMALAIAELVAFIVGCFRKEKRK